MKNVEKWEILQKIFWAEFSKVWPDVDVGSLASIGGVLDRLGYHIDETDPEQLEPIVLTTLFKSYFKRNNFDLSFIEKRNDIFLQEKKDLEKLEIYTKIIWFTVIDRLLISFEKGYDNIPQIARTELGNDEEKLKTLACFLDEEECQHILKEKVDAHREVVYTRFRKRWDFFIQENRKEFEKTVEDCLYKLFHRQPLDNLFENYKSHSGKSV